MNEETKKEIKKLVTSAIRLSIDDSNIVGFGFSTQHEKTILDNMDFLYWLIQVTRWDEREACAKVCEPQEAHDDPLTAWKIVKTIRAREQE